MKIPLPTVPVPHVCKMLRTKNAYHNYPEDDPNHSPWQLAESTTAVYWCLMTMQSSGPDEHFVHPHDCQSGRCCFHSREE